MEAKFWITRQISKQLAKPKTKKSKGYKFGTNISGNLRKTNREVPKFLRT